jgi:hypothetical protein
MKKRKLSKKLFLNKTSIANLNNMNDIKGGTIRVTCGIIYSHCLACQEPPEDPPNNTLDCNTAHCWTENYDATCVPCTYPDVCP